MKCLLCLNDVQNGIDVFDRKLNAWQIIVKYFWPDLLDDADADERVLCDECWLKVHTFHEFYVMIEVLHNTTDSEAESSIDSESNSSEISNVETEHESTPGEKVIQLEIDFMHETTEQQDMQVESELIVECSDNPEPQDDSTITDIPQQSPADSISPLKNHESEIIKNKPNVGKKVQNVDKIIKNVTTPVMDGNSSKEPTTIQKKCTPHRVENKNFTVNHENGSVTERLTKRKRGRQRKEQAIISKIVCFICHKEVKSFHSLKEHLTMHDQEERWLKNKLVKNLQNTTCPICDKPLKYGHLRLHILTAHQQLKSKPIESTKVQCDICGKMLKNKSILGVHRKTHLDPPVNCPHCDKIKPNMKALRAHISVAHKPPKHKCNVCSKEFTRPLALREHMAMHAGKSLYNCKYCAKPFRSSGNMYTHIKSMHLKPS